MSRIGWTAYLIGFEVNRLSLDADASDIVRKPSMAEMKYLFRDLSIKEGS